MASNFFIILFTDDTFSNLLTIQEIRLIKELKKCSVYLFPGTPYSQNELAYSEGSGCFAINSILPSEAALPSPFMYIYIAIIATILTVACK